MHSVLDESRDAPHVRGDGRHPSILARINARAFAEVRLHSNSSGGSASSLACGKTLMLSLASRVCLQLDKPSQEDNRFVVWRSQ